MAEQENFLLQLAKDSLWQNLPLNFFEFCTRHGRIRHYSAKQYIFFSGDEATTVYFLLKGRVELVLMSEFTEKVYRILQPFSFFPEIVLDGKSYPHAALAIAPTEVLALDRTTLMRYLESEPQLLWFFYRSMALDLRRAYRQIKNIALGDARMRLGAKIFSLAHVHGKKTPDGVLITIPLTATDLAAMCSLARESVSRILSELKEDGILEIEKKTIKVLDLDRLRGWIHERAGR